MAAGAREPFDRLDGLTPAALAGWWRRRVRRVLAIAHEELDFYRRRFDAAGLDLRDVRTLADLRRVPVFDKAALLAERSRAAGPGYGIERGAAGGEKVFAASSGTRGTSFVALPPRWRREQGRSSLRAHWWAGLRPGAPFLLSAPAWHTYATVQTWIAERLELPCAVVAGTYLPRFAERVVEALVVFRPRFLTMFLPMVFSLVHEAARRGRAAADVFGSVETLVVTGAPITPGMRAHVERLTGVGRVVELAGSSENLLAVECEQRAGLHVVPDTCYAEVLDPETGETAAPGARGRVVHTALVPWGSLFVRYDGGDLGTLDASGCPCGLPSPRLKLVGRAADAFALGGRRLLPYDVQAAIEAEVPELAGTTFAILRDSLTAGRLALAMPTPEGAPTAALRAALETRLARRFEAPVEVRLGARLPLRFKGVPAVIAEAELA